jgi:hypothetical protein
LRVTEGWAQPAGRIATSCLMVAETVAAVATLAQIGPAELSTTSATSVRGWTDDS